MSARRPSASGCVGHEGRQDARQPDRLFAQLHAHERALRRAVALVEDQVQHGEHAVEPLGQQLARRDPVRDRGVADLLLRADQTLLDRRLGGDERARDLPRGQAADRPERERHARFQRQRGVTAGEDQSEPVVGDLVHVVTQCFEVAYPLRRFGLPGPLLLAPDAVDRAVPRRRRDPGSRVVGDPVHGPAIQGDRERLLHGLLGQIEVAEHADERRHRTPGLAPEQAVDDLRCLAHMSMRGLTSTDPPAASDGILPAASIASSRFAHSTM